MADEVTEVTRNPAIADLRRRIREHRDEFTPASRAVCRSLSEISPERVLYLSAAELGQLSKTSNATVIRTVQALGYSGLAELKDLVAAPSRQERLRSRIELRDVSRRLGVIQHVLLQILHAVVREQIDLALRRAGGSQPAKLAIGRAEDDLPFIVRHQERRRAGERLLPFLLTSNIEQRQPAIAGADQDVAAGR